MSAPLSVDAVHAAFHLGLSEQASLVLFVLAESADGADVRAGRDPTVWPGHERIAATTGLSMSKVKRAMAELTAAGLIARKRRRNTSSVTIIDLALIRASRENQDERMEKWAPTATPAEEVTPDLVAQAAGAAARWVSIVDPDLDPVEADVKLTAEAMDAGADDDHVVFGLGFGLGPLLVPVLVTGRGMAGQVQGVEARHRRASRKEGR